MSHGITSTDGLVLAGTRAWHGLGIILPERFTMQEGLKVGELDWGPAIFENTRKSAFEGAPDVLTRSRTIVRLDTDADLGTVSDGYGLVTNPEIFQLAIDASGQLGDGAVIESCGSFKGGKTVFCLVRLATFGVKGPLGSDEVAQYALVSSGHDGKGGIHVLLTGTRVVCMNTWAMAVGSSRAISHTKNVKARLELLVSELRAKALGTVKIQAQSQALADTPMSGRTLTDAYLTAIQAVNGPLDFYSKVAKDVEAVQKARDLVTSWAVNMDDQRQAEAGLQGTAWAALQSVTQWANHEAPVRAGKAHGGDKRQARLYGATIGATSSGPGKYTSAVQDALLALVS